MIKPIVLYGDKILRKPTDYIREGSDIKSLIQDLWDTMYNAEGAGLAAPQIGEPVKAFVADLPDQEWKRVFINPVIKKKYGEKETVVEGCLSLPGISAHIIREDEIEISYFDENWKYYTAYYRGVRSRVIQHEYDHLDGVLWVDRVDPLIGMRMVEHLKAIQDRTVETSYPIV